MTQLPIATPSGTLKEGVNLVDETFSQEIWDAHATHPMQSWDWGEVRRSHGKEIVRFVICDRDAVPQQCFLMTVHPLPLLPWSIGYVPRSPAPTLELTQTIRSLAPRMKLIHVTFEPFLPSTQPPDSHALRLTHSAHPLFPRWNQVLDITPDDQTLLSRMHPKTRYNTRLAHKSGVKVIEMDTEEGYHIFEQLYFATCKRQRYRGHTPKYHRAIWQQLSASSGEGGALRARILVAWYRGKPLAAYELWHYHDTMYYVYGGSSSLHKTVMAPNLLMWEAIRLAKSVGCTQFDMWGSLHPNYRMDDPWAGFTRFKQGYGTQFVEYVGSFDLVISPLAYKIYSFAQTLRKRYVLSDHRTPQRA